MCVEIIPFKVRRCLKWTAWQFYIAQIPEGKCATERHLMQYLKKIYSEEQLELDYSGRPACGFEEDSVHMWRLLSATGLVQGVWSWALEEDNARRLQDEGHELLLTKNNRHKVLDYKETEINYSKLRVLPFQDAVK